MTRRTHRAFLALVLFQAAHSTEEYFFRLYDVFAPARLVSGLITSNLRVGFIIFNVALILFGLWCYLVPVRRNSTLATSLIWFWIVIELINGIGHPLWSLLEGTYTPGVVTAPILLILALYLVWELVHDKPERNFSD